MSRLPREFLYRPQDFARAREMIRQRAGIALGESKVDLVYSRLARRLRATGFTSFQKYLNYVEVTPAEAEAFVNALTTNLTTFFREPYHFRILGTYAVSVPSTQPISVWSAGCSTGEEPYSIAITLAQLFPDQLSRIRIHATDIDTDALAKAQRGVYPVERVTGLPAAVRNRYFQRGVGANDGFVRVVDEVRALVTFAPFNLLSQPWTGTQRYDAIFCRNVMIYFDKPTQRALLRRFHPLLRAGGLFMAGHSESLFNTGGLFDAIGNTVYRKVETNQPLSVA